MIRKVYLTGEKHPRLEYISGLLFLLAFRDQSSYLKVTTSAEKTLEKQIATIQLINPKYILREETFPKQLEDIWEKSELNEKLVPKNYKEFLRIVKEKGAEIIPLDEREYERFKSMDEKFLKELEGKNLFESINLFLSHKDEVETSIKKSDKLRIEEWTEKTDNLLNEHPDCSILAIVGEYHVEDFKGALEKKKINVEVV